MTALVLLGPPGGGKGTQGRILADDLRVPWLSSGALLRDAVREGTDVGRRVERSMRRGELVDDDLMLEVMDERLRTADATGFAISPDAKGWIWNLPCVASETDFAKSSAAP